MYSLFKSRYFLTLHKPKVVFLIVWGGAIASDTFGRVQIDLFRSRVRFRLFLALFVLFSSYSVSCFQISN